MTAFNGGAVRSVPTSQQHAPAAFSDESESSDGDTYPQGGFMLSYYVPPERLIAMMRRASPDRFEEEDRKERPFGLPKDIWHNWKNGVWLSGNPEHYIACYLGLVWEWEIVTKKGTLGL